MKKMKLLHFADVHIGHETYGKIDPKTGLNTRLLDFLARLDEVVEASKKVDLVIFAGDAYKTRDPSLTYQREFGKRIKKMSSYAPVVMVIGNHDVPPSLGKADTLEIFPALDVPNIYVFSKPEIKEIPLHSSIHSSIPALPAGRHQSVTIIALPWIAKHSLLTEKERKLSTEKTIRIAEKKILEIWQDLVNKTHPNKINIGVVHQTLAGALFSSDRQTYLGNDPIIPISTLADSKLSYIAAGHLHKYQPLNENPPVIYPGSLERIDFGEEKDKKGFVIVDIEKGKKTKYHFVETHARKFETITIKVPDNEKTPNQFVLRELRKYHFDDAILKIQLEGKEVVLSQVIDSDIKETTKKANYLAGLIKKSDEKTIEVEVNAENLLPRDWFDKFLKKKNFSKKDQCLLKEEAEKIFEEVG